MLTGSKAIQFRLGVGACLVAGFLIFVAIPVWVSSPSNVPNIVLAPTFWPYVLAALTGVSGLGLLAASRREPADPPPDAEDDVAEDDPDTGGWLRLALLAVLMGLTMVALPRLGMVWTCMALFVAAAFLFRTRHPVTALICAVVVPLALYAFFAHVAGVGIPQGDYLRLP